MKPKRPTMHPRNIYLNKRHDFKDLANEFPEFKANTKIDLKGRITIDFKNPAALRAFSRTLLKKDFNLDVDFPTDTLVPTIPLRLNYILFIEDILNLANLNENIRGLDIGTGASCVYPLISARENSWNMIGTDITETAITYATRNIKENKLEHLINVVQVKEHTIINEVLERDDCVYDFCMCNPPFFGNLDELSASSKPNRPPPRNAFTGVTHELVTEGGELEFVGKLIDESNNFRDRIRIFTSMVGIKRNIEPLLKKLKNIPDVKSTAMTSFFQGHTTRFGIAWTFNENIKLEKVSRPIKLPKPSLHKPLVHSIKPFNGNIVEADTKVKHIFDELQIHYTKLEDSDDQEYAYNITAYTNTWSHNRQKIRAQIHSKQHLGSQIPESSKVNPPPTEDNESATTHKRKLEGDDKTDDADLKRFKRDEDVQNQEVLVECAVSIRKIDSELTLEIMFLDGSGGKTCAHGIFQYFQNHLKFG